MQFRTICLKFIPATFMFKAPTQIGLDKLLATLLRVRAKVSLARDLCMLAVTISWSED